MNTHGCLGGDPDRRPRFHGRHAIYFAIAFPDDDQIRDEKSLVDKGIFLFG